MESDSLEPHLSPGSWWVLSVAVFTRPVLLFFQLATFEVTGAMFSF